MVFVYPVGVPLMFATILFVYRRALRDDSQDADNELVRHSNPGLDRLAVLFDVYKPEKWWWEVYESLRRVLTTGVLVLIDPGSLLQLNVGLALCLQGLVMYSYHQPYEEKMENTLAICMQLETFILVYVALLALLDGGTFDPKDEYALDMIITVGTTSCLVFGMFIVIVAMCKVGPHDPFVSAFRRSVGALPSVNDAVAPGAVEIEIEMKHPANNLGDTNDVDPGPGAGGNAESSSETLERLRSEIQFLKQENLEVVRRATFAERLSKERLKEGNEDTPELTKENEQLKQEMKILVLEKDNVALQ